VLLTVAVVIEEGIGSQAGIKSILVALLLVVLNTVLVHATARAGRIRKKGRWALEPGEKASIPER
jgi:multisubunit Na+/H+ antiporter MnhG subunit